MVRYRGLQIPIMCPALRRHTCAATHIRVLIISFDKVANLALMLGVDWVSHSIHDYFYCNMDFVQKETVEDAKSVNKCQCAEANNMRQILKQTDCFM